jgi:ribosomal protein S14
MAAPLTPRVDALEAKLDRVIELVTLLSAARVPAVAAPVKAKASSPFVEALAAKRSAKLASGTHRECPNCGKAVSVARSVELCKDCFHATPKARKARAR